MSIRHYNSIISRLGTGRAWRGNAQRAIIKVISDEIATITDELIKISKVKSILFGEEIDRTTLLNDELYALQSTFAMVGEQTEITGKVVIWEYILDMSGRGTIDERIESIISIIINAGSISLLSMQKSLLDSGFDVYLYRNGGGGISGGDEVTYGDQTIYGGLVGGSSGRDVQYVTGVSLINPADIDCELCVNYIDSETDEIKYDGKFTDDTRRWAYTFLIGGPNLLDRANVAGERKSEFRELILKTKPAGMWGLLLIDYI